MSECPKSVTENVTDFVNGNKKRVSFSQFERFDPGGFEITVSK